MDSSTLADSSFSKHNINVSDELNELSLTQGINVWSTNQETLEGQALKELEIFAEETKKLSEPESEPKTSLEEGEIIEIQSENIKKPGADILDINDYIKRQEQLRKQQEIKRSQLFQLESQQVSTSSKNIANRICRQYKKVKRKRKSTSNYNINEKIQKLDLSLNNSEDTVFENLNVKTDTIVTIDKTRQNTVNNLEHNEKAELLVIEDISTLSETLSDEKHDSGSEYVPSDGDLADSDYEPGFSNSSSKVSSTGTQSSKKKSRKSQTQVAGKVKDDGLLQHYKNRLNLYYKKLEEENSLKALEENDEDQIEEQMLKGGLKVPIKLWNSLYSYQQDGIEWLWNLHQKPTGGILGDEMGLGKTVQIIVFLYSLQYSRVISKNCRFIGMGPSIVVCPATVIHQWVQHFYEWAPEFRVAVLHQSGTYQGNKAELIKDMHKCKGVIITTYLGILKYKGNLVEYPWHYVILDEGHKIRNPSAKVSVAVKHLRTPHRIMLTGSPMQNNLTELWSLFDFTNPGMLGNLMTFQEHFANPILYGGFANASPMQEATALSVASTLKNVITPYLLRRMKSEVQNDIFLPNKREQVLFCSLTEEQRDLYKGFLMSEHVNRILGRGTKNWFGENHMRAHVLVAITTLRKICNHPDLYLCEADETYVQKNDSENIENRFGYYKRSGKMVVVSALLKIWKKQGHRVLLFSQGRSMITVFEEFLEQNNYKYLKMDGSTNVGSRQSLIEQFNKDSSYDVFLLTTRVGGVGVNLTGANRVIIYDPDWNPATDTQARERAWRIGQEKQVTIYRLLSAGTIEEKMYQRQVWKQLLSNKVLLDPSTHRFFKSSDLHDLFSLQESPDSNPETANIFHDSRVKIQENYKKKSKQKRPKLKEKSETEVQFTEDKIQAMKNLAQQIAKSLSKNKGDISITKNFYQKELEEEREIKLKEKEKLKKLTAPELVEYNRKKAQQKKDESVNKIDGSETNASFDKALEYSEKTSKLYHDLNCGKVPVSDVKNLKNKSSDACYEHTNKNKDKKEQASKRHKKKKKHRDKSVVDTSGTIDGEIVEGLVKSEIKKNKKEKTSNQSNDHQDNFVLEHLFSKKGVSGALQHDSIVDSKNKTQSLKVRTEAKFKAEKALEALRKSRLNNWRW